MAKLITPSLIGSIEWLQNCPISWKDKAYTDLKNQLGRIFPDEIPHYVKRGLDFEKKVFQVINSLIGKSNHEKLIDNLNCSDLFKKVLNHCDNGIFQQKTKAFININDVEYCLYGKKDVSFKDKIVDIKVTKELKSDSKYLDTIQHEMYCFTDKIPNFEYLVVIMDEKDKLTDVKIIKYHEEDFDKIKENLIKRISKNIEFIEQDEYLLELYLRKFNLYG